MSQTIVAPSNEKPVYPTVFLGGGITNCPDWQKEVCEFLEEDNITLLNPRREEFDINDKTATHQQIDWEFKRLERCDVFTMFFCKGDSLQPICMYELGRNIVRMQNRFPTTWNRRIIITIEPGYKRADDVFLQTFFATDNRVRPSYGDVFVHEMTIAGKVRELERDGEI